MCLKGTKVLPHVGRSNISVQSVDKEVHGLGLSPVTISRHECITPKWSILENGKFIPYTFGCSAPAGAHAGCKGYLKSFKDNTGQGSYESLKISQDNFDLLH